MDSPRVSASPGAPRVNSVDGSFMLATLQCQALRVEVRKLRSKRAAYSPIRRPAAAATVRHGQQRA
jgi:hypothetical protein